MVERHVGAAVHFPVRGKDFQARRPAHEEPALSCLPADTSEHLPDAWATTGRISRIISTFREINGSGLHQAVNRGAQPVVL